MNRPYTFLNVNIVTNMHTFVRFDSEREIQKIVRVWKECFHRTRKRKFRQVLEVSYTSHTDLTFLNADLCGADLWFLGG